MKAKGVFVTGEMKVEIMATNVNEPLFDEVMVQTKACGLCCWDSWLFRGVNAPGPMPYLIGHEGAGIVYKVGEGVKNFKPGDPVFCAAGSNEMMCEYFTVKEDCLVKLDEVSDWSKVVYEPTVCVVNVLKQAAIEPGDHVVLVGAGYMGLLTLMGLTRGSQAGQITVFEIREDRRKLAEKYNPHEVLDPNSEAGEKRVKEIIGKGGADVVIEFGATISGFELADSLVRQAGTFVIASFHRGKVTFDGTRWHLGGLRVYNAAPMINDHYNELIPRTYQLIKDGVYDPGELVTHTARFDDPEAMDTVFQRSVDKGDNYIKAAILF